LVPVNAAPSILLVEDEHRLRQTLMRSLGARHFRVDEATTAATAVNAALAADYDVVLLDVNLPDATGWDVLRRLKAAGWDAPVIVLSAVAPNPARVRELKPQGVLLKPFPIDALLNLIQAALGKAGGREHSLVPQGQADDHS
jgi:DNA-binding response OmpR family regulator